MTLALLGACTGGSDDDAAEPGNTEPPGPISFESLEWERCEDLDEGFSVAHPAGWDLDEVADGRCTAFDPSADTGRPLVEIRPTDTRITAAVERARDEGADVESSILDDRSAARVPAGEDEPLRWLFDLRNGRTLTLTGRTGERLDPTTRDAVVERMVDSLSWIDPRTAGEGLEPIGAPVTDTVESRLDHPEDRTSSLTDLRAGGHDGFDRVVLEIDADFEPSYRVEPVGDRRPGADLDVPVQGERFLEVTISPVRIVGDDGRRLYEGPTRIPAAGADVIEEAVVVPPFATDELRVAVGMERDASYAVTVIPEPVRLVVDVLHDPAVGGTP